MNPAHVLYQGSTPGADANTYTLFDSTALGMGAGAVANMLGAERLLLRLQNSHSGTLFAEESPDGGITWNQVYPNTAVAAPAAGATNDYDFLIDAYKDFRVRWTNGGSAQTTWRLRMSLLPYQQKVT